MSEFVWVRRPDLKWCPECGPNAKIESAERVVGLMYVCLSCGGIWPFEGQYPTVSEPDIQDRPSSEKA